MRLRRRIHTRLALAACLLGAGLLAEAATDAGLPVVSVDFSVDGPGENVDDPCFWVHPTDPAGTLMFVTAKESGLVEVFNLSTGILVDTIASFDRPNNCAVDGDLLLTTDRDAGNVKIHHLPDLAYVGLLANDTYKPYGISVLHTPAGASHVYVTDGKDGTVHVYDLASQSLLRTFQPGFGLEIEPIVGDDRYQRVFVSREEGAGRGIGVFTPEGTLVREIGAAAFTHDTEGLALYACGADGYLVGSDQDLQATEFEVFDRATLAHLGTFLLRQGADAYTRATDGIDILQAPLARFPGGVLAACDGCGDKLPDEMDLVPWERIAEALKLDVCPNGVAPDCRTAPCRKRVPAVADATVSAYAPDMNAGTADSLASAGANDEREALLRFAVPDLTGYDVLEGVVRLLADEGSPGHTDPRLFATHGAWDEATVTFNTRPTLVTSPIAAAEPLAATRVLDFDVRATLGAGGRTLDFALRSGDFASYRSRESGESPPALILQLRESTPPVVTIHEPAADVTVDAGTSVQLRANALDVENGDLSTRIAWTSSLSGALGTGRVVYAVLPAGRHHIAATVTDDAFVTRSASVEVQVTSQCPECDDGDRCTDDTCSPDGCVHLEMPATTPTQVLCGVENLLAGDPLVPPLQRRVQRVRATLAAAETSAGSRACVRRARAAVRAAKGLEKLVARFVARSAGLPGGAELVIESQRLRLRAEAMAGALCR